MLFHEIYGSYFDVIAHVLAEAADGTLTEQRLYETVQERAFGESMLTIPAALKSGQWPLLDKNLRTPIRHKPTMPLTHLQRRWLKALLLDKRIRLFAPDVTGLEDVEPLYRPETFVFYDRYLDGDDFEDEAYIRNFHVIRQALREKQCLRIRFKGHKGSRHSILCRPLRLEYSSKDDKFRLLTSDERGGHIINLSRIRTCQPVPCRTKEFRAPPTRMRELTFLLWDERNALERVLLHFSHLEKETRKVGDKQYQVTLRYDRGDETELIIRVLSFGPMVQVLSPEDFKEKLKQRIEKQINLGRA